MHAGVILFVAIDGVVYARGVAVLWHGGRRRVVSPLQAAWFALGWLALMLAIASPLHAMSEQLLSAHMVQHELLMVVAAPLLVLGRPIAILWAFPRDWRALVGRIMRIRAIRVVWSALTRPLHAWLVHGAAIWIWHLPVLFEAALDSEIMHAAQHFSFMASGLLFWWTIVNPSRRSARGVSVLYLFTTAVHTGVLGALMTFARAPWYPRYAGAAIWNITPLDDQHLAGMIMWIPASTAYLIAALLTVRRWLSDAEWQGTRDDGAYALPLH